MTDKYENFKKWFTTNKFKAKKTIIGMTLQYYLENLKMNMKQKEIKQIITLKENIIFV